MTTRSRATAPRSPDHPVGDSDADGVPSPRGTPAVAGGEPDQADRDRRLRLLLAYDGGPFSGFARQVDRRTVQGEVEAVLSRLARRQVLTVGAGRTDAGVHPRGQVLHADVPARLDPERVRDTLNAVLGPAIVIRGACWAAPGFDARFSARRRTYVYRIDDSAFPDPLQRHTVAHHRRPLDLERMRAAAAHLVGQHDFASFCRARAGATTVRTLRRLTVERVAEPPALGMEDPRRLSSAQADHWRAEPAPMRAGGGAVAGCPQAGMADGRGIVAVTVVADAFCHQMVRSIVGHLLEVGDGRRDPDATPEVLAARNRNRAGPMAPPNGLVLESVTYEVEEGAV
jgi:tRNA pseudouridine38-40 synthase